MFFNEHADWTASKDKWRKKTELYTQHLSQPNKQKRKRGKKLDLWEMKEELTFLWGSTAAMETRLGTLRRLRLLWSCSSLSSLRSEHWDWEDEEVGLWRRLNNRRTPSTMELAPINHGEMRHCQLLQPLSTWPAIFFLSSSLPRWPCESSVQTRRREKERERERSEGLNKKLGVLLFRPWKDIILFISSFFFGSW